MSYISKVGIAIFLGIAAMAGFHDDAAGNDLSIDDVRNFLLYFFLTLGVLFSGEWLFEFNKRRKLRQKAEDAAEERECK